MVEPKNGRPRTMAEKSAIALSVIARRDKPTTAQQVVQGSGGLISSAGVASVLSALMRAGSIESEYMESGTQQCYRYIGDDPVDVAMAALAEIAERGTDDPLGIVVAIRDRLASERAQRNKDMKRISDLIANLRSIRVMARSEKPSSELAHHVISSCRELRISNGD